MSLYKKQKLISIIQARMSSKRLPGKVLLELGESNVIGQDKKSFTFLIR